MKRKIYVASSWRNEWQPDVARVLRAAGHEVYDFRNPPKSSGFAWSQIDENWESWTTEQYVEALKHPIAIAGFNSDFNGMAWADTCVMVLPCGRSANTEAGYMKGEGKEVFVLSPTECEPELMYKIYDGIFDTLTAVTERLSQPAKERFAKVMIVDGCQLLVTKENSDDDDTVQVTCRADFDGLSLKMSLGFNEEEEQNELFNNFTQEKATTIYNSLKETVEKNFK